MSKQDRVAPRTAADIERKYNFGQTFGEFAGLVDEAKKAAADAELAASTASSAVNNLDKKLDQDEIFNRLTNNGESQGIYRAEDGQIYINASYIVSGELLADLIKAGVLKSKDGTISLDLSGNSLVISMPTSAAARTMNFLSSGLWGYGEDTDTGELYPVLQILPAVLGSKGAKETAITASSGSDLVLATASSAYAASGFVRIGTSSGSKVKVKGKTVSWKDNGDGTYTLIGTD